ncbi:hypothetical protein GCM10023090_07070 [Acidovorax lacteus]|uniref:Uncharacterized protein n=1 Tax=Acidovorax lacteus TaxID=1924988 RepID=A0ABP8L1S8_9BURK
MERPSLPWQTVQASTRGAIEASTAVVRAAGAEAAKGADEDAAGAATAAPSSPPSKAAPTTRAAWRQNNRTSMGGLSCELEG